MFASNIKLFGGKHNVSQEVSGESTKRASTSSGSGSKICLSQFFTDPKSFNPNGIRGGGKIGHGTQNLVKSAQK